MDILFYEQAVYEKETKMVKSLTVMFWPFDPAKNAIQGDAPEGSDTF